MTGSFYAVVPAGGSGTRLWPLSRESAPKFLHRLGPDTRSLMQLTLARIEPLAPLTRTLIVCGQRHHDAIANQIAGVPEDNYLVEPAARNSGPAIALAAAVIESRDPDAVMGSFAADHLISVGDAFRAAVRTAAEVATTGRLVTVGITATRPETGYGYIRTGAPIGIGEARDVESFKEKPDRATAEEYLASGRYLWNAGMFVWRVRDLMAQLRERQPEIARRVQAVADLWDADRQRALATLDDVWAQMPSISIDHAVIEGAAADGLVATIPADMGWSDIGDWDTVAEMGLAPGSRLAQPRDTLLIESPGSFATSATGRAVTVIGVPDVVVVETDTSVLVVHRDHAQQVKDAVDEWKARGRSELL